LQIIPMEILAYMGLTLFVIQVGENIFSSLVWLFIILIVSNGMSLSENTVWGQSIRFITYLGYRPCMKFSCDSAALSISIQALDFVSGLSVTDEFSRWYSKGAIAPLQLAVAIILEELEDEIQ
ncbi:MAG TPA: hypothetical protein V6C85_28890, partial [Allocoleopsis sp.]